MKFHYYADSDSLYIDVIDQPSAESREVAPGVAEGAHSAILEQVTNGVAVRIAVL